MISERSDNTGLKSSLMKLQGDPSKNSLLSTDLGKKTGDKKTNDFKQSNEISNNKRKNKSYENDSIFEAYEEESEKKKKIKEKSKEEKKIDKIIVDDIENIYSCLNNRSSKRYCLQNYILIITPFFTALCHWIFLLLTKSKTDNNYCFSDLNQLDKCITDQICDKEGTKLNLIIYDETFEINDDSLTSSKKFIQEMKLINSQYKTTFMNFTYSITKDKLLSSVDPIKFVENKLNFAVVLTKNENWNIFLYFYDVCLKDNIYLYLLAIIIVGGAVGSIIFGLLADIYGRKKIIIVLIIIIWLSFSLLEVITIVLDNIRGISKKEYEKLYHLELDNSLLILSIKIYSQKRTAEYFEKLVPLFFIALLMLCLALRPLNKICFALLLENSISDLGALENFRDFSIIINGFPFFLAHIILVYVNNFYYFLVVFQVIFLALLIISILFINESMRYHYEYCEWTDLTKEIHSLFKITEELPINYKNNIEYEAFRIEENRQMNGNYIKRINSIFQYVKQKLIYLKRDIRRNSSFIIKKEEVKFNPLIILTSLSANRVFNRLKFLLLIILFITYIQIFFVERELVEILFNKYYYILIFVSLISNIFYYMCYRISCFKLVFYPSLVFLTILLILYYYLSRKIKDIPVILNYANFGMKDYISKQDSLSDKTSVLCFIYFFLIGINFYVNILVTKITKTLYRGSLFGINSFLEVLAIAFGETLRSQIDNCFLLIAGLNSIGIVSELYLGELKGIPNIINDLKQNIKIEDNKNKEKSKKTIVQ